MCQYSVEELTCTMSKAEVALLATEKETRFLSKSAHPNKVSDISIEFPNGESPLKSKRENVFYHQSTSMTIIMTKDTLTITKPILDVIHVPSNLKNEYNF